jgi:hypothetical protein
VLTDSYTTRYNDVQCGNGPANDAGDEDTCPGRIEYGAVGCKYIGPKWNFVGIKVPTKAPLSVPVKAPVVSPVVASTKAPTAKATAAPVTSGPTALKGCYLRELGTGKETLLTGSDWYDVNNATNPLGFSIRCDVSGLEEIVFMKFIYNGKEHDEWGEPRWLDGDSFPTPYVVPVAFLSMCGPKTVTVQGNNWSGLRFQKVYSLVAKCSGVTNGPTSNAPTTKAPTTKAPVSLCT